MAAEIYRSRKYSRMDVAAIYVRYEGSNVYKFFEVNGKNWTIREYTSDGSELDETTRAAAQDSIMQVKWGGAF